MSKVCETAYLGVTLAKKIYFGQRLISNGERARSRTWNLLIKSSLSLCN